MKPEVTIICATKNALNAVKLTLLSLKKHTAEPFKLLIADNDSDDGTLEFIRALPYVKVYSIEFQQHLSHRLGLTDEIWIYYH